MPPTLFINRRAAAHGIGAIDWPVISKYGEIVVSHFISIAIQEMQVRVLVANGHQFVITVVSKYSVFVVLLCQY